MMSASTEAPPPEAFASWIRLWERAANDDPGIEDIRVTGDVPAVRFRAVSDDVAAADAVGSQLCELIGGAVAVLQDLEDAPDVVELVGLPADRDAHEGGIRWRLRREWAEAHAHGERSSQEVLEAVDETAELLEA